MIAAWMLHAMWISALLAGAAALAERALRLRGRAVRGVWVAALLGSFLLPAAALLTGGEAQPPAGEARGGAPAVTAAPGADLEDPAGYAARGVAMVRGPLEGVRELAGRIQNEVLGAATGPAVQAGLAGGWTLLAAVMGGLLLLSVRRLDRERRGWPRRRLNGLPVRVSPNRGPGVVGLLRAEIVVPAWVLELDEGLQRMICLHEGEHLRAGDHRLFAAGLAAALLLPWNLPLWWQLRRLRLAIECDCDRRVLRRGIPPRGYADLLLRMGRRLSGLPLLAAPFAERTSNLEARIRTMTSENERYRSTRAVGAAVLATGLVVLSCESPPPDRGSVEGAVGPTEPVAAELPTAGAEGGERPKFIPYDEPPRLRNPDEVVEALREAYPAELREAGVGGRTVLFLKVDSTGAVDRVRVQEASGREELDAAAVRVADAMRFRPAVNRDRPTAVWVTQPVTFQPPLKQQNTQRRVSGELALDWGVDVGGRPLIILDGQVLGRAAVRGPAGGERLRELLGGIGPDDIAVIEFFKGEAAAARYGEQARDGLVQIITKAGNGGG